MADKYREGIPDDAAHQRRKRGTYGVAVTWIALNDECAETNPDAIVGTLTVLLVADVFGVVPARVAQDVIDIRTRALDWRKD